MGQIVIVYYSETGNTEAMANMVAKGVEAAGATAKVVPVDGFNAEELKGESAFALVVRQWVTKCWKRALWNHLLLK